MHFEVQFLSIVLIPSVLVVQLYPRVQTLNGKVEAETYVNVILSIYLLEVDVLEHYLLGRVLGGYKNRNVGTLWLEIIVLYRIRS